MIGFEKSTTKAIAVVDKIDNMLQRQIVVNGLGKRIDIEDAAYRTYAITDFHSIAWIFIFVSVTIYRTVPLHSVFKR
jgi:hypothetical protein